MRNMLGFTNTMWKVKVERSLFQTVEFRTLGDDEIAQVFAEVANKRIIFQHFIFGIGNIYHRIERDGENHSIYFHYWIFDEGKMTKVGSGGYIPDLHKESEKLYEFAIKEFTMQNRITE